MMNILPYLQGKGKHKHFIILFYTYHVGISVRFLKIHKYGTFSKRKQEVCNWHCKHEHMKCQTSLQII
jgi:hypothetical protein